MAGVPQSFAVAVGDMVSEGTVVAVVEAEGAIDSQQVLDIAVAPGPESVAESTQTEIEVLVPDIGDAIGVVVIEVAVAEGDEVAVNDLLVVLESDKASMEIAAEHAGTVTRVAVSVDEEVEQGSLSLPSRYGRRNRGVCRERAGPAPALPATTDVSGAASAEQNALGSAARVYAGPAVSKGLPVN